MILRVLALLLFPAAALAAPERGQSRVGGTIVYVTHTGAFINRGADDGVARGDVVTILRGKVQQRLQVLAVSDRTAYCPWPQRSSIAPSAALSAPVRVIASSPPRLPPEPKARAATNVVPVRAETLARAWNDITRAQFPVVPYTGVLTAVPGGKGPRVTVAAAHESWGQVSGGRGRFEEERFFLTTLLGGPGRIGLDVDLDGIYFTRRPPEPRFAGDRSFQISAHRAQLRYVSKDSTFFAGFGRMPSRSRASSRPLDGLEVAFRVGRGVNAGAVAGFVPDVELQPSTRRLVAGGYFIANHDFSPTTRGRFDVEPLVTLASETKDVGAMEIATAAEVEAQHRVFAAARAKIVRDLRPESASNPIYLGNASADLSVALQQNLRVGGGYRRQDRRAEDLSVVGTPMSPLLRQTDAQIDGQIEFRPSRTFTSFTMVGSAQLEAAPSDSIFAREEVTFGPYGAAATRFGLAYLYNSGVFDYHQPEAFVMANPGERLRLHARYAVLADAAPGRRIYGHSGYLLAEGRLRSEIVVGANARYLTLQDSPDSLRVFAYVGKAF